MRLRRRRREEIRAVPVRIIGVYSLPERPAVHLIEAEVDAGPLDFDMGDFTQADRRLHKSEWQTAYSDTLLNEAGDAVLAGGAQVVWDRDLTEEARSIAPSRVAFFFHYLDPARPLLTPGGPLAVPPVTPIPARLARIIVYEEP
jgi:hypothetical protein